MTGFPHRILILAGILLAGFCATFLIPDSSPMRSSRMGLELPPELGEWTSRKVPIGERELSVLADDTVFERRVYGQTYQSNLPPVEASVVFSGKEMNTSIHRPEVCLRTQGWSFSSERYVTLPDALPGGEALSLREILCTKIRRNPETGQPVILANGSMMMDWQLIYYTFIGSETITASHYGRVFSDMRDRVLGGYDQQWAYATFSSLIPGKYHDQGVDIGLMDAMDTDQTAEHLRGFIKRLLPLVLKEPSGES